MRIHTLALGLAAGLALTACNDLPKPTGQAMPGTATGSSDTPVKQDAAGIAGTNSLNSSAGSATFSGTQGSRPSFDYTGQKAAAPAGATSLAPPSPLPRNSRGN